MQSHYKQNSGNEERESILIIGGDGTLATALRSLNHDSKIEIVFSSRSKKHLDRDVFLDLNKIPSANYFEKYSTIVYLAQSLRYREYPSGLSDLAQINIIAPRLLAEIAAQHDSKFVYFSTGSVYPSGPLPNSEYGSFKSQGNLDSYSISKIFGEKAVEDACPRSLILRPFFIFGNSHNSQSLFPSLYRSIQNGETITLKGLNGLVFNPISSIDAAKALIHLLSIDATGVFNLCGNEIITLREVIELLSSNTEREPNIKFIESEDCLLGNPNKLIESGFHFPSNLRERIVEYVSQVELAKG
jgi:UDP-glucose 4-epimerase